MNTVDLTKLKDGEILHFKCGGSAIVSHVAMFHGQFHIDIEGFCSQVFNKYGELCVDGEYLPNSIFSITRISRVGDFPFEQAPIIAPDDECKKHMKATMNQGIYGKDHREAQRYLADELVVLLIMSIGIGILIVLIVYCINSKV